MEDLTHEDLPMIHMHNQLKNVSKQRKYIVKMKHNHLQKKIKSLQSLPKPKRGQKEMDMSFIDGYSDEKIHDICEACYNIVHKKLPLKSRKKNQLKQSLMPIHKHVRQLANPQLQIKTKRRILKNPQTGAGIFTALASIVVPTLLSLLTSK